MGKDLTSHIRALAGIDGTIPHTIHSPESLHDDFLTDDVRISIDGDEITVGYVTHDPEPRDYFADDEGAGEFRTFRRGDDPNEIMDGIIEGGRIAFFVERYSHGLDHYSVAATGGYPDHQWDVGVCGIIIPCEDVQETYRQAVAEDGEAAARKAAIQDVNHTLDEYSKVCNGETYGACVEKWRVEGQHVRAVNHMSTWGLVGSDHAIETLKEMLPEEPSTPDMSL